MLRQQIYYDDDQILARTLGLKADETERFDVFVMEKCDGSLKDHIRLVQEIGIDYIITQLLEMAELLKTENICHNDVKPSNILYKKIKTSGKTSIQLKLSDFGMSDRWGGTPGWSPHNFTRPRKPGDDLYSFGLVILYLLCDDKALFYTIRDTYLIDYSKYGQTKYRSPPIGTFRNLPEIRLILEMLDLTKPSKIDNIKVCG